MKKVEAAPIEKSIPVTTPAMKISVRSIISTPVIKNRQAYSPSIFIFLKKVLFLTLGKSKNKFYLN